MDNLQSEETRPIADDLLIGAEEIAKFLYNDAAKVRDVYRNIGNLSFFKHGAHIAAFKSTLRGELREAERRAREQQQQSKADPAPSRAPKGRRAVP